MSYGLVSYLGHAVAGAPPTSGVTSLNVGGGGFIQGLAIASDNTMLARCDTYGAYKWNPTGNPPVGSAGSGVWSQMVNATSMPADYVCSSPNIANVGCYEIRQSYGNSSIVYMIFADYTLAAPGNRSSLWQSTDGGATWPTRCAMPADMTLADTPANEGTFKEYGPKIAVAPNWPTSKVVLVGTKSTLYRSTDGTTFSAVSTGGSGVPTPSSAGFSGIWISSANPNNCFVGSNGNGVYGSTDAGATWAAVGTGGPTTIATAQLDENTGFYYCIDSNRELWRWNLSTWTKVLSNAGNTITAFAVDPNNPENLLAIHDSGGINLNQSTNSGGSWTGWTSSLTQNGSDVGWIAADNLGGCSAAQFDRITAKKVYFSLDRGVAVITWSSSISSANAAVMSRGIDQLVGNGVCIPPGGSPVALGWDFGTFYRASNSTFPPNHGPFAATFTAIWDMDYAKDSVSTLACIGDGKYIGGSSFTAKSTDAGQTWSSVTPPYSQSGGGYIAVSTALKWLWAGMHQQPYYTLDGGSSWTAVSISGLTDWSVFGSSSPANGRYMCADKVNAGEYTICVSSGPGAGFYDTADGGATWNGPNSVSDVAGGNAKIKAVDGNAGHRLFAWGFQGNGGYSGNSGLGGALKYSTDHGRAWTAVGNVSSIDAVGTGKATVTYPDIYVAGWITMPSTSTIAMTTGAKTATITGSPGHTLLSGASFYFDDGNGHAARGHVTGYSGGVLSFVIDVVTIGTGSTSGTTTFHIRGHFRTSSGLTTTPVWVQYITYPNGIMDVVQNIDGDPNTIGKAYIAFGGSSFWQYSP